MMRYLLILLLLLQSLPGFDRAVPGYDYQFPRDHFAHPNFQIEWWYFTGNLTTEGGRRFGFELTFFRNAVEGARSTSSSWEVDQIYLAHLALSDIEESRFTKLERVNRAGPGIAGADEAQARIWNGNWEVRWVEPEDPTGPLTLRAVAEDFEVELELRPRKTPVVHGRNGVSQKAEGQGRASHYVSCTRLEADGAVQTGGERHEVTGSVWMDHEFSTDSMGPTQVGWDWVSAQLEDGSELMLYRMRREDGSTDPFSSGSYVDPAGRSTHLVRDDFSMTPGETWTSPITGGVYPVEWRLQVPRLNIDLQLTTPLNSQEVISGNSAAPSYWEGAIDLEGSHRGVGYLEMTGYDEPIRLGVQE